MKSGGMMQAGATFSLLDPQSCGEDLKRNAARIFALAPEYCTDCADFHVRSAAHRCAVPPKIIIDRPELIQLLRHLIADAAARDGAAIDILIPGSADTAILATTAHAAATLGRGVLDRCRFIVLDRCRTPLVVCGEFATDHGLRFQPLRADLATASGMDADLIVLHSTFRFIRHAEQAVMLDRLGSWLKPAGRLVFSNRILLADEAAEGAAEMRRREIKNRTVAEALAQGSLDASAAPQAIMGHLERAMTDWRGLPGEFRSLDEVRALFGRTGLRPLSVEELHWDLTIAPGDVILRRRVLAVLAKSEPPS